MPHFGVEVINMKLTDNFRRLMAEWLGEYFAGYEYQVPLKDIKIPAAFAKTKIRNVKWQRKVAYYERTGELESTILLSKDFTLVDGYSSYLIAKEYGIETVPVYFV